MIYRFKPILKPTIWGGENLRTLKHLAPSTGSEVGHIGESWEISALPGYMSCVAGGMDMDIGTLCRRDGVALLGKNGVAGLDSDKAVFPLLIKFIDAAQDLSVQVHPDDEVARKHGYPSGKNEMWYIIDAKPGAVLYAGLRPGVSRDDYLDAVTANKVMDVLERYDVRSGDAFFLPAGTIHSIGAGVMLAEVQQCSDITYRIYDFDRRDAHGNLRELHTALALDAIDFSDRYEGKLFLGSFLHKECPSPREPLIITPLTRCDHFVVDILDLGPDAAGIKLDLPHGESFTALIAIDGQVSLGDYDGQIYDIQAGQSMLIPADTPSVTLSACGGQARLLAVYMP